MIKAPACRKRPSESLVLKTVVTPGNVYDSVAFDEI